MSGFGDPIVAIFFALKLFSLEYGENLVRFFYSWQYAWKLKPCFWSIHVNILKMKQKLIILTSVLKLWYVVFIKESKFWRKTCVNQLILKY